MFKLFFIVSFCLIGSVVSIYNYETSSVDNGMIRLNDYRNKKIFIVNTASNSELVTQLTALQQLYQQHHDSMIVIAFPSNSFGHEPLDNAAIKNFMLQNYSVTFPIAVKSDVAGPNTCPIYRWFRSKLMNNVIDANIAGDFNKFLINSNGKLVAQFNGSVSPLDSTVQNAIRINH